MPQVLAVLAREVRPLDMLDARRVRHVRWGRFDFPGHVHDPGLRQQPGIELEVGTLHGERRGDGYTHYVWSGLRRVLYRPAAEIRVVRGMPARVHEARRTAPLQDPDGGTRGD